MKTVAVETGLTSVSDYLREQGVQVVAVQNEEQSTRDAAVMVISGIDKNMMGMQDVVKDIPVISAEGMSPEQVYQQIKTYLQ